MSKFGFTVEPYNDKWCVSLPHSCDAWEITDTWEGNDHSTAVQRLEEFIAEAQEALAALVNEESFGDE